MLAALAVGIMSVATWASNVWPGVATWPRAAAGRAIWWGAPMGLIVWLNGASVDHAMQMAAAAWIGAWVPQTTLPDVGTHWPVMLRETGVFVLRVLVLLAPPAVVFHLCGAYWWAMVLAALSAVPAMQMGASLPHHWLGLRDERDVSGVVFGASVGFWLAVAVWTPTPAPDLLP